jgi:tRNA threonylcarbamoyladenosine biosynthesis protein TsaE
MQHFKTTLHDEAGTLALATALAQALLPGLVIYLHGDLGAGKTTLTRALLHACGHIGPVKSPTYTLAETYTVQLPQASPSLPSAPAVPQPGQAKAQCEVVHFDLYRMASAEEFLDAGFREYFNNNNICIIEWPEKGEPVLPAPDIDVFLDVAGTGRRVELSALSEQGSLCLSRLHFAPNL